MRLKSILQYIVTFTLLNTALIVFAENTALTKTPSEIRSQEVNFHYNWNDEAAIKPTRTAIKNLEAFLKTIPDFSKLNKSDRQAMGKLLYKLGTYYSHTAHKPDLAIVKLNQVDALLTSKENKAWTYNQLAYAYELKYAASKHPADKQKGLAYTNKVITDLYPNKKNKEVAFAYSIKALIENDAKQYTRAEKSYRTSLKISAALPSGKDDQYERGTTVLAGIILNQHGREKEALALLEQVKHYWIARGKLSENPQAAINFISLGQAYLKVGNTQAAHVELSSAMNIYKNVYGNNSALLVKPYTLLAVAYKKQGDKKLATFYINKANAVDRA